MRAATLDEMCVYDPQHELVDKVVAFSSDLGWTAFAVRDDVLVVLVFGHATADRANSALGRVLGLPESAWHRRRAVAVDGSRFVARLVDDLRRFAEGEPVDFSRIAIDQRHLTPFGRRVTAACRRIPQGQTRTYGQLATVCGSPGAARAVGQVMARNRFPLIVPCHRVLAAGDSLGGFSAPNGLAMKRRLLELEMAV